MTNERILWILAFVPMVCHGSVCYGCYGGWQREVLDWGMIGSFGIGGYLASKAEPFFEQPLIGGPGDKPYKEEQVPNSWLMVASAAMVGLSGLLPNQDGWLNSRSYRHLKGSLLAVSSGLFIKELCKDIVGRPRPDYYDRLARGIDVDEARESWPSGHATHAAGVAIYLSLFTWDEWRDDAPLAVAAKSGITALLAAGATWVSYTRVADNRHYVGDVVAGSIIGAGTALLAYSWQNWWGAPKEPGTSDQSSIIQATPLSIGVRLSF
jgi:membrane-associated phospholipid phosphatase